MKKIKEILFHDSLSIVGIILIIVSAIVFAISSQLNHQSASGVFFINYLISVGYLLTVFIRTFSNHGWSLVKGRIEHTILLLVLWFISAFALNRDMNVFDSSVVWLSVLIVISSIVLVL